MDDPKGIAAVLEAFVPRSRAELLRARQDLGMQHLTGSHEWALYRTALPELLTDVLPPNGSGFLGFSSAELSGIDDVRLQQLHDEDRGRVLDGLAQAMESGDAFVLEYRLWSKNRQSMRRFQDRGRVETDRSGRKRAILGILLDITTQRKPRRVQDRAEQEALSRLGDLPGIVFRCRDDPDWTTEFVSGSSRSLTGYAYPDLLYNRRVALHDLIHRDDRRRVEQARRGACGQVAGYRTSYRLLDASQGEHFVVETGRGVRDEATEFSGIEAFIFDQTEQEVARQALAESEERFRSISSAAQDAILMLDDLGRIVFWNPAASRIFGHTESEALGKDAHLLLAPRQYQAQARAGVRRFAETGKGPVLNSTLRFDARRRDGSEFPVEVSVSGIRIRDRWHAVGVLRDVTDREQALAAARESEARFRTLFNEAPDGMLVADPETAHFVAGNRRMAEQLRCSESELTTLGVGDIHPEADVPWILETFHRFHRLAERGHGEALDVPVKRRDGSLFIASITTFFITLDGRDYLVGSFRDVTDRKEVERALQEERRTLQLYLDNTPVITVVFDVHGSVRMINRLGCELLGYSSEEVVGRNWFRDFVPAAFRDATRDQFSHCFRHRACVCERIEIPVMTRTGQQRLISWRNEVLESGDGTVDAVLCTGEDVTERRRMEQDLQSTRERLELVVSSVPAVLYACAPDPSLAITFVGASLTDQFGMTADKVIGRSGLWLDFAHPDDAPGIRAGVAGLFDKGRYQREFRLRIAGDRVLWVENVLRLVRDAADQPLEVVGFLLDITERKQAEQALREREMSLNHAQAIANLGSWESNLESGEEKWSDEVFRILGYAPQVFVPKRDQMLERIHPADVDRVQGRLNAAVIGETGFDIEFRVLRPNDEERFVRARGQILRDADGRSASVLGTLLDFTERKLAETKLEKSRQSLRELARHLQSVREEERAGIAREIHDELGQGLTALKIDVVRLRSRIGGREEDQAVAELIDSMLGSIDTTIDAVQRVMAELRPSILDDLGLVAAVEWQTEQFQQRTGIACTLELPDEETDLAQETKTALFRILQESLTNVARHSGATQVEVSMERRDRWLTLTVADNGKGISPLDLESNRSFGLLGMRERAQVSGGWIDIQGKPDGGSSVRVRIPVQQNDGDVGDV
jgi:PAS domain S-box-containing protein